MCNPWRAASTFVGAVVFCFVTTVCPLLMYQMSYGFVEKWSCSVSSLSLLSPGLQCQDINLLWYLVECQLHFKTQHMSSSCTILLTRTEFMQHNNRTSRESHITTQRIWHRNSDFALKLLFSAMRCNKMTLLSFIFTVYFEDSQPSFG